MPGTYLLPLLLIITCCCSHQNESSAVSGISSPPEIYKTIGDIPEAEGFGRLKAAPGSFEEWLRIAPLKKDKKVYLHNGLLKHNQSAQFAVIDISVGKKDLQQCADAVMRLRAEFLFAQKKFSDIAFMDYDDKWYKWTGGDNRSEFDKYLNNVFGCCGSASLEKQLKPAADFREITAGDVFVQGGFPGHAMLVVDVAMNEKGKKIFMLAQGYQPAQDIHVVINPMNAKLSPWYDVNDSDEIITPEWKFMKKNLKTWE